MPKPREPDEPAPRAHVAARTHPPTARLRDAYAVDTTPRLGERLHKLV